MSDVRGHQCHPTPVDAANLARAFGQLHTHEVLGLRYGRCNLPRLRKSLGWVSAALDTQRRRLVMLDLLTLLLVCSAVGVLEQPFYSNFMFK